MPPENLPQQPTNSPELEAMLMQKEDHHNTVSAQLDTLIHQGEANNPEPVLEASLLKLDEIADNTKPKEVQKMEIVPPTDDESAIARTFWQMLRGQKGEKGDQGEKGDKGDKGEDSTVEGPQGEAGPMGPVGPYGPQGPQGNPGRDGRDGQDGRDGAVGPRGPRGEKGADGSGDTGQEIVSKISGLKGDARLSYKSLKDAPEAFGRLSSRDYAFTELTDAPKSYVGQAGKVVKVKTDETGLEFGTGGGGGGTGAQGVTAMQAGLLLPGATIFLGMGQAYDDEFPLFVARVASKVTELLVTSVTGNGPAHTDTYKVFKNGIATTMTLAVTASTNGEIKTTVSNQVSLAVGDRIAVQVTTDAGTVAANTLIQMTVTPN